MLLGSQETPVLRFDADHQRQIRMKLMGTGHAGHTCVCVSVCRSRLRLSEDMLSADVNGDPSSGLGGRPKALSGIEFLQTSFNQQVFKVRITLSPPACLPRLKPCRSRLR